MLHHRGLEPVDVAAISGFVATFFGATLMFLSTHVSPQATSGAQTPPQGEMDATNLLEPKIGEAIVAAAMIEHKHSKEIARAAKKLNTDSIAAESINLSGNDRVQGLVNDAQNQEASKRARVELVKGRHIVNSTLRAQRGSGLSDEPWDQFNRRSIATAADEGNKIERRFRTTAPERFRTALEDETAAQTTAMQRSQEKAGAAVVATSLVENDYQRGVADVQEQLGSLVSTATIAERL